MAKSRREAMYDHDDSKKRREGSKPKAESSKPDAAERGSAEMLMKHRNERRDMHNQHRSEHDAIDKGEGPKSMKKTAAHHRQRVAMDQMHDRHEQELMAAEQAQPGSATAPEAMAGPAAAAPVAAAPTTGAAA